MIARSAARPSPAGISAARGSKRTSPSARCGSSGSTYGGLAAIRSKRAVRYAVVPVRQQELDVGDAEPPRVRRARSPSASVDVSVASDARPGPLVRDAPARSRRCRCRGRAPRGRDRAGRRASASSTSASVSGRGISTAGDTARRQSPEFAHAGQVGDRLAVASTLREREERVGGFARQRVAAVRGEPRTIAVRARARAAPARRAERGRCPRARGRPWSASVTAADCALRTRAAAGRSSGPIRPDAGSPSAARAATRRCRRA